MNLRVHPRRPARRREPKGLALIYILVLWTVVVGFVSLALDWGRAEGVKTQLQQAADAAARAANAADGTAVVIDPNNDVEFGTWDSTNHTFTVLSGAVRSGANSVRVTASRTAAKGNAVTFWFASLIGQGSMDVHATATAAAVGSPALVGLSLLNPNGNRVDSWNSSVGSYTSFPMNSNASCASNASIDCHNSIIKGSCQPGNGKSITNASNVSGLMTSLPSTLAYPTPIPGTAVSTNNNAGIPGGTYNSSTRDVNMGSGTYTWPGGTYYLNNVTINSSTINFTGPAVIYITGTMNQHNVLVTAYQNRPKNLQFLATTSASFSIDCDLPLNIVLYAPLSSVSTTGLADAYGSIIANSVTLQNDFHIDESLGGSGVVGGPVSTVK
jgi:hypothetical protein